MTSSLRVCLDGSRRHPATVPRTRKRRIRSRIARNSPFSTATSAIWKMTYRVCMTRHCQKLRMTCAEARRILGAVQVPVSSEERIRHMQQPTTCETALAMDCPAREARDVLTEALRQGAQRMLAEAIENELAEYIAARADQRDAAGLRLGIEFGAVSMRVQR